MCIRAASRPHLPPKGRRRRTATALPYWIDTPEPPGVSLPVRPESSLRDRLKPEIAVAIVYVAAMFVNILDSTVVTVALPTLSREFDVTTSSIEWVVTGYLLSLAVFIPASGWIGDKVGTKRTFLFAIAVFTSASALCGLATSLNELIAFRILQGVGGGMLTPTGYAMLMRAFPPERRAAASKVLIIPTAIAPASGPIVGGFLVDWASWRWVFYINVPLGIATLIFGWIFLHEARQSNVGRFDFPGFVLSGGGLALILFALSEGPMHGWASPLAWGSGLAGGLAFTALVVFELRIEHPMLQLRLIGDRLFRQSMLTSTFSTASFLGILFVMPLFLQEARGISAIQSGLTTFPEAVGVLSFGQIAGRLYPSIGPRRLMTASLVVMSALLASLTLIDLETNLWLIRLLMFMLGATMSFTFIPLQAAAFARIAPAQTGRASAIYNTQRQMASALGVAILATILSVKMPGIENTLSADGFASAEVTAYHTVFLAAAGLALVGAVFAWRIKDADAEATMVRRFDSTAVEPAA
jgi:EmrB/QacA subfamily drug resistance transporter